MEAEKLPQSRPVWCWSVITSLLATGNMQPPRGPMRARGERRVLSLVAVNGIFQEAGEQRASHPRLPGGALSVRLQEPREAATSGRAGASLSRLWGRYMSRRGAEDISGERERLELGLSDPLLDTIINRWEALFIIYYFIKQLLICCRKKNNRKVKKNKKEKKIG